MNQSVELARCQAIIEKLQYRIGIKSNEVKTLKKKIQYYDSKVKKPKAEKAKNSRQ